MNEPVLRLILLCWLAMSVSSAGVRAASDEVIAKAEKVYKQFCSHCHGPKMVNPGTASFDLRKFPRDAKERFVEVVTKGKGDMPAWGDVLFPEELDLLWTYVATRAGKELMPDAKQSRASPPPELMQAGTLTVCLAHNGGAMSARRADGGIGLDYAVAAAVADHLKLDLKTVWFESEVEEESDPVRETFAMLSKPLCDLVPGHPLYAPAVGKSRWPTARPPRWRRLKDLEHVEPLVPLKPITVTEPYRRNEIGIVLAPSAGDRTVVRLDQLAGLRVAAEQGTLAGAILMAQAPAIIRERLSFWVPGPKFLWEMEAGKFDAALVDVSEFDFHKRQNGITRLRLADYRHSLSFNFGFAVNTENAGLKDAVDEAVGRLLADAAIKPLARAQNLHYAPPRKPHMRHALSPMDLLARR